MTALPPRGALAARPLLAVVVYVSVILLQPIIEQQFGLHIPPRHFTRGEYVYLIAVVIGGLLIGLIPAWKAYRNSLSDGLSVRM